MNSKKIITLTILSLMFLVNVNVLADDVPGIPHTFYGKVYLLGGGVAPAGLTLVAKINNTEYGRTTTFQGEYHYYFAVSDSENKNQGETIYFYVNGIQANPTYKFNSKTEGLTELDLTLTGSLPTPTTTPPAGPSGGGGGGGGATTTTTTTTTTIPSEITPTTVPPGIHMDIVSLTIPDEVNTDEPFDLEVTIKNIGDTKGSDDITISLPENWKTDKWRERVTLSPDETTTLYFSITPSENSGEVAVGSSIDFEVSETITPIKLEPKLPITGLIAAIASWGWWILIIVIIILVLIYLLTKERKIRKKPVKFKYKYKSKKR